ncbi:hypothetical protein A2U01_0079820, partial [Trifolium medium]|nr:hypothetical protein [Trifolium medium]
MGSKWGIEELSEDNLKLWKVVEAILMSETMDKTWSVVIRCLG